jgi:ABC-type sugar transport system ATPase subunit
MEIISSKLLKYNIGLDAGDNLTNILFEKNTIIPNNKSISFIIPELDEDYKIDIIMGDNILATDNIVLEHIELNNLEFKKIFFDIKLSLYGIIITISNKAHNIIYQNILNYYDNNIIYYDKIIDIAFYKLKFDILQTIKIIKKKIKLGLLIFDEDTKILLEDKLNKIINSIDTLHKQKMLDIKNNLKAKFFID